MTPRSDPMRQDRLRAGIAVATLFACAALGLAAEPARSAVAPAAIVAEARGQTPVAASPPVAGVALTSQSITPDEANAADGRLGFTLRNIATAPLPIAEIAVEEAMVTSAGTKSRLPAPRPAIACGFDPAITAAPFTLPPLRSCRVDIPLVTDPAGKHEARVTVTGGAGGVHGFRLAADIKRGPGDPITLILLGLVVGALVSWWSGRGRERWSEAAGVKASLEMLGAQAAAIPDAERRLRGILAAAADLQRRILAGEGHDPAEVGELGRRVRFINYYLLQERNAGTGGGTSVTEATTRAILGLAPGPEGRFDPAISETSVRTAAEAIVAAGTRAGGIESADAAPTRMILPVGADWSATLLTRFGWVIEIAVSVALAAVFAAVALQSMYFNQPVWGSATDRIAAFIIGFGAYAGSVASVDAFLARARKS